MWYLRGLGIAFVILVLVGLLGAGAEWLAHASPAVFVVVVFLAALAILGFFCGQIVRKPWE